MCCLSADAMYSALMEALGCKRKYMYMCYQHAVVAGWKRIVDR